MRIIRKTAVFLTILFTLILVLLSVGSKSVRASENGYFHTSGGDIVDSGNREVKITGINWFGLETPAFTPHGLWARSYKDMIAQMKSLGYNTIRLPFSNQALESGSVPSGINYDLNADLRGLSGLGIMDKVIEHAGQSGMRVILDRHRPDAAGQSALWYTDAYPESRWIADWKMLAKRYAGNSTVIGADLHNEPHDQACWGCGDTRFDWRLAAEKAGNAIHSVNPELLIFVEGIQAYNNDYYWWGGNLSGVRNAPVRLNKPDKVVYSPHDYPSSLSGQPWFTDASYPANLPAVWDAHWGYIAKERIAPVLLGEFGSRLETDSDRKWFTELAAYLKVNGTSWTFWSWNPNSGDTGGLLKDDWQTVNADKQQVLSGIQSPLPMASTPAVPPAVTTASPVPSAPAPTDMTSVQSAGSAVPVTYSTKPKIIGVAVQEPIDIWWPTDGASVSDIQPFKATISKIAPHLYSMYWQVDGGQLNEMSTSYTDAPHKEAIVDVAPWHWRGQGPYSVTFIAIDGHNREIVRRTVTIYVPH